MRRARSRFAQNMDDLTELRHQLGFIMQPPGGVYYEYVRFGLARSLQGLEGQP